MCLHFTHPNNPNTAKHLVNTKSDDDTCSSIKGVRHFITHSNSYLLCGTCLAWNSCRSFSRNSWSSIGKRTSNLQNQQERIKSYNPFANCCHLARLSRNRSNSLHWFCFWPLFLKMGKLRRRIRCLPLNSEKLQK